MADWQRGSAYTRSAIEFPEILPRHRKNFTGKQARYQYILKLTIVK